VIPITVRWTIAPGRNVSRLICEVSAEPRKAPRSLCSPYSASSRTDPWVRIPLPPPINCNLFNNSILRFHVQERRSRWLVTSCLGRWSVKQRLTVHGTTELQVIRLSRVGCAETPTTIEKSLTLILVINWPANCPLDSCGGSYDNELFSSAVVVSIAGFSSGTYRGCFQIRILVCPLDHPLRSELSSRV
jgi:hypothetical protein